MSEALENKAPDDFKNLAGASGCVRGEASATTRAVFPLRADWSDQLSAIALSLAEHTRTGKRLDQQDRRVIEGAIDYFNIALKNADERTFNG